jgi:hypothetical protein
MLVFSHEFQFLPQGFVKSLKLAAEQKPLHKTASQKHRQDEDWSSATSFSVSGSRVK